MVEIVITITVMSLIAISMLPRIIDLISGAKASSRDKVVSLVQSGIGMNRLNTVDPAVSPFGTVPAQLDAMAPGAYCHTGGGCFINVLEMGHEVRDSRWRKINHTTYEHDTGPNMAQYVYNNSNGTFKCNSGSCL